MDMLIISKFMVTLVAPVPDKELNCIIPTEKIIVEMQIIGKSSKAPRIKSPFEVVK